MLNKKEIPAILCIFLCSLLVAAIPTHPKAISSATEVMKAESSLFAEAEKANAP